MRNITDTTHVAQAGKLYRTNCETFTPTYEPRVDLYWVVDHTESMDDDYPRVLDTARELYNRFDETALQFRMGVTSMETTRHGRLSDAGWHDDFESFESDFDTITEVPGDDENMGMQSARAGLRYMLGQTSADPGVSEQIRPQTQVFTIFASDDEDQYFKDDPLDTPAGETLMDDLESFFTSYGMVYALVGDGEACGEGDGASYRELAQATSGNHDSICATDAAEMFDDIVDSASGSTQGYELPDTPIVSSLRVWQGEEWVPRSREDGWDYFPDRNSIVFFGSYRPVRPPEGQSPKFIAVHYEKFENVTQ